MQELKKRIMIELKLTEGEVNIVGQALSSLPYSQVAELISNIQNQINVQETENKKEES